jgi:hypothetical protein
MFLLVGSAMNQFSMILELKINEMEDTNVMKQFKLFDSK